MPALLSSVMFFHGNAGSTLPSGARNSLLKWKAKRQGNLPNLPCNLLWQVTRNICGLHVHQQFNLWVTAKNLHHWNSLNIAIRFNSLELDLPNKLISDQSSLYKATKKLWTTTLIVAFARPCFLQLCSSQNRDFRRTHLLVVCICVWARNVVLALNH